MKTPSITFIFILFVNCLFAQDLIYTVSGELNEEKIGLDSILVENLTTDSRLVFDNLPVETAYQINLTKKAYWGTTTLRNVTEHSGFVEYRNEPGVLTLAYLDNSPTSVTFSIFNIKGQKIYKAWKRKINPGNSVRFRLETEGVYIVKVQTANSLKSFKAIGVNNNSGAKLEIVSGSFNKNTLKSSANKLDENLNFSIGDSIRISVYKNGYYAFPVGLNIVGSDFIDFIFRERTVQNTGISDAYIPLDENTTQVISFDLESGNARISYTGKKPELFNGAIITLDMDSIGYLRKVIDVAEDNGILEVKTGLAFMNDIFVNKEIKLNTELMEPGVSLKSNSTLAEISKALTDENGFIHPVEIIYYDNNGSKKIKNALITPDVRDAAVKVIDFNKDLKTDLYGSSGSNIHLHISEGHANVSSNAIYEFDFKNEGELTKDTKIEIGDLKTFSYYLDGQTEFLAKLALDLGASYSREGEKELIDFKEITVKFAVGVVPVWITFDAAIFGNYSFESSAALHEEWGFKTGHSIKVGGNYNKQADSFTPIKEYTPLNKIFPLEVEGELKSEIRFELYPRIEAKFYGFFGPYTEIVPFAQANFEANYKTQITSKGDETFLAWNSGIYLGLDLRVGTELTFLWGLFNKEFGPTEINCFNTPLWQSPKDLSFITTLPAEADSGAILNLHFNVTDNLGNAVALCPIFISGDGEFDHNVLFTDSNGIATANWTLSGEEGSKEFTAKIFKADGTVIKEITESTTINGGGIIEGNVCATNYSDETMDEVNAMNSAALTYAFNQNPQTCKAYKDAVQAVLDILEQYVGCDMTEDERNGYDLTVMMTQNQLNGLSCE